MTPSLKIYALGGLSIREDDEVVSRLVSRKADALVVYLAYTNRVHPRDLLAELLWDERSQDQASANLRVVLTSLRHHLGAYITITRQEVGMKPNDFWIDALELESGLEAASAEWKTPGGLSVETATTLSQTLDMYQGDFLSGLSIYECKGFEDWMIIERDYLRGLVIEGLHYLVESYLSRANFTPGFTQVKRLLQLDPLREEAHRQLMMLLAHTGQRAAALAQYETCRRLLRDELDVAPSRETTELYAQIRGAEMTVGTYGQARQTEHGLASSASLAVGQILRGYQLQKRIGAGGFGAVYLAHQIAVDRDVVIKAILPEHANEPEFIRRFEVEAKVVANLEHPHIVPLYDFWREPNGAYLVMRWLPTNLRAVLTRGRWEFDAATRLLDQVASALWLAHQHDIIHRDIKPDNILLDDDYNAYLSDFGIAKSLSNVVDVTPADRVVGSASYLSPEQIKSDPVSPRSDIYSLGIVLYELLTGEKAYPDATTPMSLIYKHLNDPLPSVTKRFPDLPENIDGVIQRATAKNPAERFDDTLSLARAFRAAPGLRPVVVQHSESSRQVEVQGAEREFQTEESTFIEAFLKNVENPYKGLRAFDESDSDAYFGRTALIEQISERLTESGVQGNFLAVVGPSGSGKSSVIKAGLLPAIRRGRIPGSDRWFIVEMLPGSHPLHELEIALRRISVNAEPVRLDLPERNPQDLLHTLESILPGDDKTMLLLVIDQFEEVFTLVEHEAERAFFLNSLLSAVTNPTGRLRLIITLRADFYDRPLMYEDFGSLLRQRTELVLPLSLTELEQAITQPARSAGIDFEPLLIAAIIEDVRQRPGTLPLLQYALTEIFDRRTGQILTLEDYQAIGGVFGALARRAEDLFDSLDENSQEIARQIFLRLVTLGESGDDTRRRTKLTELTTLTVNKQVVDTVIDSYCDFRLLTLDRDPLTREPTVEVAHEALISAWERLRLWINLNRAELHMHRLLQIELDEWIQSGQDRSYLAVGARLAQFETLIDGGNLVLSQDERAYIEASLADSQIQETEDKARQERTLAFAERAATLERLTTIAERRAATRLRYFVAALAIFVIIASGLSIFTLFSRQQALTSAVRIEGENLAANSIIAAKDGDGELATLLAMQSVKIAFSPESDAALQQALNVNYVEAKFEGYTDAVNSVAFFPDSNSILTGSADQQVDRWDLQTKTKVAFIGATQAVNKVAVSANAAYVLAASDDQMVYVWSASTRSLITTFKGHVNSGAVLAVAIAPNNQEAVSADDAGQVILWNLNTGKVELQFTGHTKAVHDVVFSPDGNYIATASDDTTARIWDVHTGNAIATLKAPLDPLFSVAFFPDEKFVVTGGNNQSVVLWDIATQKQIRSFIGHTDIVNSVAISSDGKYVLSASADSTARLWDASTGQELRRYKGHTKGVSAAAFSPDSNHIVTGGQDKIARLWSVNLPKRSSKFAMPVIVQPERVYAIAFSPDNKSVAVGGQDARLRVYDVQTGALICSFPAVHLLPIWDIDFSPNGEFIASGSEDKTVAIWDAKKCTLIKQLSHPDKIWSLAFSPNSQQLITGGEDKVARLWDIASGSQLMQFPPSSDPIYGVAFSPDGETVAAAGADQIAHMYDIHTGKQLQQFVGHTDQIYSVAFSPDGKLLLTGSLDRTARLWDIATGQVLRIFNGHTDGVWVALFAPDGKTILTAAADQTTRLWDRDTGQERRRFVGHTNAVTTASFSPDGTLIATGSVDRTIRFADVDPSPLLNAACAHVLRDLTDAERREFDITDSQPTCS